MFEAAELGTRITKDEYKARVPALRESLLEVQQELRRAASFQTIVVLAGLDTAGRGETANMLNEWMDPRWVVTRAWDVPSDEERDRPPFWRYLRALPPRGRVGLFLGGWYEPAVYDRVERRCDRTAFKSRLDRIARFEKELADDGAVILKFWLHLDVDAQRRRLKTFTKDPLRSWRVTKRQWRNLRQHDQIKRAAEMAIRRTSTSLSPWHIVEGVDERYRNLMVATHVRDAIRAGFERVKAARRHTSRSRRTGRRPTAAGQVDPTLGAVANPFNVLNTLDLDQKIEKRKFRVRLERQQGRLNLLQRRALAQGTTTLAVFEGWDAAGKGGAIRRVTSALDARDYRVIPIGAPSDEELAHHYLWRFWRHLSRAGQITIFDRSWYGRVLVERVEGFATREEYKRAYAEIINYEEQLVEHGILLTKFWLHISKDEQLRRFQERQRIPHKRWKITDEDWRNRRRWNDYELAVNEMVARTSTRRAPWVLVEANDKYFARIKVIRTLADRLARALKK